jgi:hypothetical protein
MRKSIELFLGHFLYPLLVILVTATVSAIVSKVQTGNWFTYFQWLISIYGLVAIGLILVAWAIFVALQIHSATQEANAVSGFAALRNDYIIRREIAEYEYEGVLWRVLALDYGPYVAKEAPSPTDLESEVPPRCPRCKTDLEEIKAYWGYYVWNCPRRDFRKRTWKNFYASKESVQRIIQADFRNYLRRNT